VSHFGLPTPLWFALYGLLVGAVLGLPLAALCAPVLGSARLRALFALGPTSRWASNYVLAVVGLSAVHGAGVGALSVTAGDALAVGNAALDFVVLFVALVWLGAVVGLPRRRYEWRGESPVRAGGLLAVALGWYATVTTLPLVLLTAIASI
jgi:hypothetical protein